MERRHEQLHCDDRTYCSELKGEKAHCDMRRFDKKKLYLFINGVLDFSTTLNEASFATAAATLGIGAWLSQTTNRLVGKMDELRISNGVARYTAAFTPA